MRGQTTDAFAEERARWALTRGLLALSIVTSGFIIFDPAPTDVFAAGMIVLALVHFAGAPFRPDVPLFTLLHLFVIANLLSMFAATDPGWGLRYLGITLYLVLFAVALSLVVSRAGPAFAERVLLLFAVAAAGYCAIGVAAVFQVLPASDWFFRGGSLESGRVRSTFGDPNVFGPYAAAGFLVFCHRLFHGRRRRLLYLAPATLCLAGVVMSFSRGAWLALGVSLVFFYVFNACALGGWRATWRTVRIGLPVLPLIVGATFYALATLDLFDLLATRFAVQSYDSERFTAQAAALATGLTHPIGIGPGHFTAAWSFAGSHVKLDPHNVYLRIWAENGILGIASFAMAMIVLVGFTFGGILKRNSISRTQALVGAILMGILADSVFIDTLHWRHFFFMIGIASGLTMLQRRALTARWEPAAALVVEPAR